MVVEVDGGAAWVMIRVDGSLTPSDHVFYTPSVGWRLRSVDPRGGWPRFTPMSAEGAAHHLIMYGIRAPWVNIDALASVLAQALTDAIPLMEAAIVMCS